MSNRYAPGPPLVICQCDVCGLLMLFFFNADVSCYYPGDARYGAQGDAEDDGGTAFTGYIDRCIVSAIRISFLLFDGGAIFGDSSRDREVHFRWELMPEIANYAVAT